MYLSQLRVHVILWKGTPNKLNLHSLSVFKPFIRENFETTDSLVSWHSALKWQNRIFLLSVPDLTQYVHLINIFSIFILFFSKFCQLLLPGSQCRISTFKTKKTGNTWRWLSTYSYNMEWSGSFNGRQHGSGSLLQKGWAPRPYRVVLRSMGSTHFWPITIHWQSVVGATIFKWIQWNMSQATKILPAFSLK